VRKKPSQLERDTAAYFANLTEEEAAEERRLEKALCQSTFPIHMEEEQDAIGGQHNSTDFSS